MKEKKSAKPVSFRKKTCYTLAFCAAWLLLYLVLSGYHLTPNQALRSYEDTLLLSAPTQMLMQGKSLSAPDDFVRWRLSENEDCLLFSLYFFRPRMDGWSATGSLLEYQRNTPVEIAIDHSSTYEDYWFGKISDPAVLSMEVRYETAQGEAGSETFWTKDMLYHNGAYYFVVPASSSAWVWSISQLVLHTRTGGTQIYDFEDVSQ